MKYTLHILIFFQILSSKNAFSQLPNYNWTKQLQTSGNNGAYDAHIDSENNLYVIGNYTGIVDLNSGIGEDFHISLGGSDFYVIKMDLLGNYIWGKSFGGYSNDFAIKLSVDSLGSVYVTGNFSDSISFSTPISINYHTSNGASDIFVIKLDSLGDLQWSKTYGGIYADFSGGLSVDEGGSIVVTGDFNGTIDFNPDNGSDLHTTNGALDFFVLRLDTYGNYMWAHSFGSTNSDRATGITIDGNDNIIIGGFYNNSIDFDPGPDVLIKNTVGSWDVYVLKLYPNGDLNWVRTFGGSTGDRIEAITCDPWNNIITTGRFGNSVDFDSGPSVDIRNSNGFDDIFVHKLDSDGNYQWCRTFGSPNNETSWGICSDNNGDIYTTGQFSHSMDFDPSPQVDIHSPHITLGNTTDIFLQNLNSDGSYDWTRTYGYKSNDAGYDVVTAGSSLIYLVGMFKGTVDFNPYGSPDILNSNEDEAFIHKLNHCSETTSFTNIETCEGFISPSGNYFWTSTGTYNDTLLNSTLCDSILTINLVVHESFSTIDEHFMCDSLVWIDGNTYLASNYSATHTLLSVTGCDSVVTLNLTISDLNASAVQFENTIITDVIATNYQWLDCSNNHSVIVNETSQIFSPTINGSYAVEVQENGCIDTSNCVIINSLTLNNMEGSSKINIYPNPANETVSIELNNAIFAILIRNSLGQIVERKESVTDNLTLDITTYASGVYFITLYSPSADTIVYKLVVN